MAQFREKTWMTTPLGDHLQAADYELGDTITFCSDCTRDILNA
ncbi:hypothetical protein U3A55_11835 [Salarchaeum sp. III]